VRAVYTMFSRFYISRLRRHFAFSPNPPTGLQGATVSIPVLLADNPQKRVDYHLKELTKALQEQYPEVKLFGGARCWQSWRGCTSPGDIIATVRAEGKSYPFDQS
jgi:hypothetical protein